MDSTEVYYLEPNENKEGAKIRLNGNWIYEGNVGNDFYSQEKYFLINNPNVYILYGSFSLGDDSANSEDNVLKGIEEYGISQIISGLTNSPCEEKTYGARKVFEYKVIQEGKEGQQINSVLDFFIENNTLYSFSYNYIGMMEDYIDYQNALLNFDSNKNLMVNSGDFLGGRNGRPAIVYDKKEYEEFVESPKKAYNGVTMGFVFLIALIIAILSLIVVGYKHFNK